MRPYCLTAPKKIHPEYSPNPRLLDGWYSTQKQLRRDRIKDRRAGVKAARQQARSELRLKETEVWWYDGDFI